MPGPDVSQGAGSRSASDWMRRAVAYAPHGLIGVLGRDDRHRPAVAVVGQGMVFVEGTPRYQARLRQKGFRRFPALRRREITQSGPATILEALVI